MKNIRVANMNVKYDDLFTTWLNITKHFHKMSPKQISVVSSFIKRYYVLKREVDNDDLIWKLLFNYETKKEIMDELDISNAVMQNILTDLRKKKVIINNKISRVYIPVLSEDPKNFKVIFNFNIFHE